MDDKSVLLGCDAAALSTWFPILRDNVFPPFLEVEMSWTSWPLQMRPIHHTQDEFWTQSDGGKTIRHCTYVNSVIFGQVQAQIEFQFPFISPIKSPRLSHKLNHHHYSPSTDKRLQSYRNNSITGHGSKQQREKNNNFSSAYQATTQRCHLQHFICRRTKLVCGVLCIPSDPWQQEQAPVWMQLVYYTADITNVTSHIFHLVYITVLSILRLCTYWMTVLLKR